MERIQVVCYIEHAGDADAEAAKVEALLAYCRTNGIDFEQPEVVKEERS